jgi:flagellar hook-associated protein 3 FlgL
MRITSGQNYEALMRSLQNIRDRMQQAQTEMTTGDKINQPSDDPAGAADLVRLTSAKSEIAQYTSNAAGGKDRLDYTDTVLGNVQTMVQRVISLGESSLGNLSNPSAYTTEMNGIRDQLVSTANSSYQGTYLFGGSVQNQTPYATQPDQSVTYQGNSALGVVQIGRSSTLQVQIPGNQIFSGSINVFSSVKKLSDAITAGDKTAIQTQLTNLQQYYDSVSSVRAQVGALSNQAQSAQSDLQSYELARSADQARIQNADLAQATTDFTQTETQLQAAIQAGAKISRVSLLDYLN